MKFNDPLVVAVGIAMAIATVDPRLLGQQSWMQPTALTIASAVVLLVAFDGGPLVLRPPTLLLAAWLGWACVGAVLSPQPGTALLTVAAFASLGIGAIRLAHTRSADRVILALLMAAAVSFGFASTASLLGRDGGVGGRLQFLFIEPNQLARGAALVLVACGALVVPELLGQRRPLQTGVYGAASLVTIVVLILTESRTGVAAAGIGCVVVLVSLLPRRLSLAAVAVMGLAISGAVIVILSGAAGQSINESLARSSFQPTNELQTLNGRTVLWPEVLSVARERPVAGIGLGRDVEVVSRFESEGRVTWNAEHTHSLPLQLLLTTGVPGLLLAGAAIVVSAILAWRAEYSQERTVALGSLAVIIVDGIVEPTLRVPGFAWVLLCALGTWGLTTRH